MSDRDRHMGDDTNPEVNLEAVLERALDPGEVAEIMRLDQALAEVDLGRTPDLDPTEDPELFSLVAAARKVDASFEAVTTTRAFNSFHHRSRNAILHTLEAERPVPLRERIRVVVAAAAGIAAVAISVATLGGPALDSLRGDPAETGTPGAQVSVANLTHVQTQEQLDRLSAAVDGLRNRALSGQSLSSAQLHEFTENAARVADSIERQPDTVSPEAVRTYMERTQAAQEALSSGQFEPGAEDAAVAAQRAAEDGLVVASRYLGGEGGADGDPLPGSTATATASATLTETAEPTTTPTSTGTATATGTPTATPSGTATTTPSVTPTATPSATPTSTGTATGTATPRASSTPNTPPTIE